MSGVSLTSGSALQGPTMKAKDPLGDFLPGPPTAAREFRSDDTLVLFAEFYENAGRTQAARPGSGGGVARRGRRRGAGEPRGAFVHRGGRQRRLRLRRAAAAREPEAGPLRAPRRAASRGSGIGRARRGTLRSRSSEGPRPQAPGSRRVVTLDLVQTVAFAGLVLFAGYWVKRRVPILSRYNIPAPVVGGLPVAAILAVLYATGRAAAGLRHGAADAAPEHVLRVGGLRRQRAPAAPRRSAGGGDDGAGVSGRGAAERARRRGGDGARRASAASACWPARSR